VRAEEKEVDGLELERAEHLRSTELEKPDEERLEAGEGEELRDVDLEHRDDVLAVMQTILAGEQVVINDLPFPAKELRALAALKAAVDGRDGELSQFVYASDRAELLEQALGVLQPSVAELPAEFQDLIHSVSELRHNLDELDDAQDELLKANPNVGKLASESDHGDEPGDKPGKPDDKPGARPGGRRAAPADDDTSLTGPPREIARPASTLVGPGRATTDLPEPAKPASTLTGPARKEAATPPSSLGEPADLAAAARVPWWKRGLARDGRDE